MLNQELIKRILLEKPKKVVLTKRDIPLADVDSIYVILGPRRAGKTFFLFQIIDNLKESGVEDSQILYVNFEDERLANLEIEDLQLILDTFYSLYPENKKKTVYFMFDEIQNAPHWPKFVRRVYDKENCRIFITSSSAKLLGREIATELRGRTWNYHIFPFSFKEYLSAKGLNLSKTSPYSEDRYMIVRHFQDYLLHGGFPEVIGLDEFTRCAKLQNYYETTLFRDVVERYKITNVDVAKDLFRHLATNFARPFSVHKFFEILKSMNKKISKDYLYTISSYLEDSLYVFFVPIWTKSTKTRMINPKKVYSIDNGFSYCLLNRLNADKGWLYENLVAVELLRRGYELTYFKGKTECDFIAYDKLRKEQLVVQVTLDPNEPREIAGIKEAMERTGVKKGLVLTESLESAMRVDGKTVEVIPIWKWLLGAL